MGLRSITPCCEREAASGRLCEVNMELPVIRNEFGFARTQCGCARCSVFCRFMPGYLIPSDLERLIPPEEDPFTWARSHLRALMVAPGGMPSLVPAQQADGHCHWYQDGGCAVWQNSPYGCAFFDQHMNQEAHEQRNQPGRKVRQEAFEQNTLYAQLWQALTDGGLVTAGRGKELNERLYAEFQEIGRRENQAAPGPEPLAISEADAPAQRGVVELFAYTCPASRRLHHEMQRAQSRHGDQLVLHLLPVPMCSRCNAFVEEGDPGQHRACEYARLAWAVKIAEAPAFQTFHEWLMQPHEVPRLPAAHRYAGTLVGPDALERALTSDKLEEDLQHMVRVYGSAGRGRLPKLIHGMLILDGEPNGETLEHFLGQLVGLKTTSPTPLSP